MRYIEKIDFLSGTFNVSLLKPIYTLLMLTNTLCLFINKLRRVKICGHLPRSLFQCKPGSRQCLFDTSNTFHHRTMSRKRLLSKKKKSSMGQNPGPAWNFSINTELILISSLSFLNPIQRSKSCEVAEDYKLS